MVFSRQLLKGHYQKIPLAGIARATGVSERWLQSYVNDKYSQQPQVVTIKKRQRLNHPGR